MRKQHPTLGNSLRLPKSIDYWYEVIMGGLLTSIIMIGIGSLFLAKLNLKFFIWPYAATCITIVSFYQWHDDALKVIDTGFSKSRNFELVTATLDSLNWHYKIEAAKVDLELNKYALKFLNPTIIPDNDRIYINFKYHSTTKTGRLPFCFGISTYLEWTFRKTLQKTL